VLLRRETGGRGNFYRARADGESSFSLLEEIS
jgi:hypothetical protein